MAYLIFWGNIAPPVVPRECGIIRTMSPKNAAKKAVNCNLCGADETELVYATVPLTDEGGSAKVFAATCNTLGEERLVRCRMCGLMYLNPFPPAKDILEGYAAAVDDAYVAQEGGRLATFEGCWQAIGSHLKGKEMGRVLDVGAAAGYFLKVAKDRGWEVHGVEPNRGFREYSKKHFDITIKAPTLEEGAFPDKYFDLVTIWDVIEHIADPAACIREARRVLKDDGVLVVNYPDISDVFARMAGKKWWFLLSAHLYYFTPETMTAMLKKEGFKVLSIKNHFQKLQLGYLFERLRPYSPVLSRLGLAVVKTIGLYESLFPYYASQRRVVANKSNAR